MVWARAGRPDESRSSRPASSAAVEDPIARAYRDHGHELTRFASGIVGPHDAADVVASAVARTWTRSRHVHIDDRRAYLFRAVYRESISWRRQRARRTRLHERAGARREDHTTTADAPDVVDPVDPRITSALESLSARQRAVIVLTYWQDLHPDQIAALLDTSVGTVRKHLARGRAALREALA